MFLLSHFLVTLRWVSVTCTQAKCWLSENLHVVSEKVQEYSHQNDVSTYLEKNISVPTLVLVQPKPLFTFCWPQKQYCLHHLFKIPPHNLQNSSFLSPKHVWKNTRILGPLVYFLQPEKGFKKPSWETWQEQGNLDLLVSRQACGRDNKKEMISEQE